MWSQGAETVDGGDSNAFIFSDYNHLLETSERLKLDFVHFSDHSTSPESHPQGTAKES